MPYLWNLYFSKNKKERLEYFSTLYENARMRYADSLELFDRHMSQYKGSAQIDGSNTDAKTVRNISYEIVESQISSEIPYPKVDAASYSEQRTRGAAAIERLCRNLRAALPFREINDIDERYTYIYGGSVLFAEWDNLVRRGREIGGVKIHSVSPRDFIPQPGVCSIKDMDLKYSGCSVKR